MLEQLLTLPLEKKVGQLFFIGLPGPELDAVSADILERISPGGVCLFARNIKEASQTRGLLDGVRDALPVEPFLSIDQEGGLVDRLRRVLEPMPAVSALKTFDDVREIARITAEALNILGFNMNFAPVADVITGSRESFQNGLHSRSFGRSKEAAAEFSIEYLKILQSGGILGCVKHFPGLGASRIDSHEELPAVDITRDELEETDLFPYSELFAAGEPFAVMNAHAAFPNLDLQETDRDGKLLPSSLSYNFITVLLRDTLGFNGLALTDDLEMGAILKNYGIGQASKMAVEAGEDLLLICARPEAIFEGHEAVLNAVVSGEISELRIDESLVRIAGVKSMLAAPPAFDAARLDELSEQIRMLKQGLS